MGLAKAAMIERDERGWADVDKKVCADCVEDEYLKALIDGEEVADTCDYCGRHSRGPIAAPVELVLTAVAATAHYFYCDPNNAGVPYEGGWAASTLDTYEVLNNLDFECHEALFDDIVGAIDTVEWVHAAGGFWLSSHRHEILTHSWDSFVYLIKHQTRFFFHTRPRTNPDEPEEIGPNEILAAIADAVTSRDLIVTIGADTVLVRARRRSTVDQWTLDETNLSAPPAELARAGRMNPAGISYLYLAMDEKTAIAEIIDGPPCGVAIGTFRTTRPLRVLDLTTLPAKPSLYDDDKREDWEVVTFLTSFVSSISKPVRKDGLEHIEYVPSQVVCEYFATVFHSADNAQLDGIIYPSTVYPSGRNLVLFPTERTYSREFAQIAFVGAREEFFEDWNELTETLS